ncbi:MAG: SPOR domain-containing protein [Pseudomonadota bacterium]
MIFLGSAWSDVIASDDAPYKRAPDERGGLEVAGQDKAYYDSMDGMGDPAMQKTSVRNPAEIRRRDPVLAGGPAQLPPIEGSEELPKIETAEPQIENGVPEQPITIAAVQPATEPSLSSVPEYSPQQIAPAVSRFTTGGSFQVQLSALRSEDAARSAWERFQSSAPDLYQGAKLDIQRADLGSKGVFYRLRIGSFASRDAAKGFCADVKATGKDCMVVEKAVG